MKSIFIFLSAILCFIIRYYMPGHKVSIWGTVEVFIHYYTAWLIYLALSKSKSEEDFKVSSTAWLALISLTCFEVAMYIFTVK